MARSARVYTAAIANGATVSDVIEKSEGDNVGFAIPAAFTGTTITFQVCATRDGTFQALYDSTYPTPVSTIMTVAVSRSYNAPLALQAWPFFKLVSGSAEGAARAISVTLTS